ncbi:menaquinone-dependent protoporphyrinogen oxidase [Evansella caseinilytica]|uniref:Menaquinone-dependent protoporphyrinogen oxidase n=1 Tax=Evansella caseinilytica TaxID=1503961 RepID=A0A1H3IHP8_9BACI|nr:flavodoxin domain-containing protein [Evansella caseinilytica]SDY27336.1 menaquinone-dependent protoporphyrinogen oxidase [Evansella caseinilytica]
MKHLIVYCTSHGTTEKAAEILSKQLKGETIRVNLKMNKAPDLSIFDTVLIGGSIHAGNIQRTIKKFIRENEKQLYAKEVGLFLCCMYEGEKAKEQFNQAFPEKLRQHSSANSLFGGEFLMSKMNFIERKIIQKVSGTTTDTFNLDELAIEEFAEQVNALRMSTNI